MPFGKSRPEKGDIIAVSQSRRPSRSPMALNREPRTANGVQAMDFAPSVRGKGSRRLWDCSVEAREWA